MQRYCLTEREREEAARRDQITLLRTVLCYLIDPAGPRSTVLQTPLISTWQENIGFLDGVMKCITLQICGKMNKQKRWDIYYHKPTQVKLLPLPHSIRAHTACVHTGCTHAWAESHMCNKAAGCLCQFASSKHPRQSVWAFILCKKPATNTAAQRVVQTEKDSQVIPFQALWQTSAETSTKIIEVRGRFPKVARTLADTEWYIQSPECRGPIWSPDVFSVKSSLIIPATAGLKQEGMKPQD